MGAQGSHTGRRRELDALATERPSAVPFLPTLLTAVVIAAASLLCRQPAAPDTVKPAPSIVVAEAAEAGLDSLHRPADGAVSAALAFGRLYPLDPTDKPDQVVAASAEKPAQARTARAGRKTCGSARCAETLRAEANRPPSGVSRLTEDAAASLPAPFRADPLPAGGLVPDGVLPFAPTAAALVDGVEAFEYGAASLGSVFEALIRPN